jgi:hypothetical protein
MCISLVVLSAFLFVCAVGMLVRGVIVPIVELRRGERVAATVNLVAQVLLFVPSVLLAQARSGVMAEAAVAVVLLPLLVSAWLRYRRRDGLAGSSDQPRSPDGRVIFWAAVIPRMRRVRRIFR